MPSIAALSEPNVPNKYSNWVDAQKFDSRGRTYTYSGKEYQVVLKKQRNFSTPEYIARVSLASFAVLFTLGIALCSKTIRNCFTKRYASMRFSIPTASFQELKEAPQSHQINTKLATLKNFYLTYFKATNNQQAIIEVVDRCLDVCSTIQDLNELYGFIQKHLSSDAAFMQSAPGKMSQILNKVVDSLKNSDDLKDVACFIYSCDKSSSIVTEEIMKKVALGMIRSGDLTKFRGLFDFFGKHIIQQLDSCEKKQALAACHMLLWNAILGDQSDIQTAAAKYILASQDQATREARLDASYYAMHHKNKFTNQEAESAARFIVTTITNVPRFEAAIISLAINYVAANRDSFTLEEQSKALRLHFDGGSTSLETIQTFVTAFIRTKAQQKFSEEDLYIVEHAQHFLDQSILVAYVTASNDINEIMAIYKKIRAPSVELRIAFVRKLLAQAELGASWVALVDSVVFGSGDVFTQAEKENAASRILQHTELKNETKRGAAKYVLEHRASFTDMVIQKAVLVAIRSQTDNWFSESDMRFAAGVCQNMPEAEVFIYEHRLATYYNLIRYAENSEKRLQFLATWLDTCHDIALAERMLLDCIAICTNIEQLAKLMTKGERFATDKVRVAASKKLLTIFDVNTATFVEPLTLVYRLISFMFSYTHHYSSDELTRAARIFLERNDFVTGTHFAHAVVRPALIKLCFYIDRHPAIFTVSEFQRVAALRQKMYLPRHAARVVHY